MYSTIVGRSFTVSSPALKMYIGQLDDMIASFIVLTASLRVVMSVHLVPFLVVIVDSPM